MRAICGAVPKTLVRTAIVATALVANLSSAEASSGVTVSDDFEDAALNALLWSVASTNGAAATQTGGALRATTQAGQDLSFVAVESLVALTGDFNVTVAYRDASIPNYWTSVALYVVSCDGRDNMNIYLARSVGFASTIESTYFVDGVQQVPPNFWTYAASDTTGKFRIARTGSSLTSYFGGNPDWQPHVTAPVFDGPARIRLVLYSQNMGAPGTAPSAVVLWDDVSANSQGATGCP